MNRNPVTSSTIKSIGYDAIQQILEVEFKSGGLYQYTGVSSSLFDRFLAASSKGRFFDQFIRDKFPTRKIH